jgi:aminoacylase
MNRKHVIVGLGIVSVCVVMLVLGVRFKRHPSRQIPLHSDDSKNEVVSLLCEYLRIDTTTQHADYESAIKLFERHAQTDGFETQRIGLPSGRTCLVIIHHGTDKNAQALALYQHMDVVPVGDVTQWKHAPFAGECEGGVVYGRGTQDMKGVGSAQYAGLQLFKQQHGTPQRTICLILVPDEEVGGFTGSGQLVATQEFKALNIGYVLDEGIASGQDNVISVVATQRKPLQIVVECSGTLAHGSMLLADNAAHRLIAFLERIRVVHAQHQKRARTLSPGLLTSFNITGLDAGDVDGGAMNTVPARARATIDIRVAPHESIASVKKMLDDMCHEFSGVSYRVQAEVADSENRPTILHGSLHVVIDAAAKSVHCTTDYIHAEHASDLRFYLQQGIVGLGVTPFTTGTQNHAFNESLPVADLMRGVQFFYHVMKLMCTGQST